MQESDKPDEESPDDSPNYEPSPRTKLSTARARALQFCRGKSMWDVVDEFTLQALVDVEMVRQFGDAKEKFAAAREILQTWIKMPPRPTAPPAKGMSAEDYQAALEAAEQDAAVQAYLIKKGWTPPTPAREKN